MAPREAPSGGAGGPAIAEAGPLDELAEDHQGGGQEQALQSTPPPYPTLEDGWLVLIYRVPSESSNNRVSVWRELKRHGALYLQQCACVMPRTPELQAAVSEVRDRVVRLGGSSNLFEVAHLPADEEARLIEGFRDLAAKQYAEIVEECETKFVKEIEFERFRENFTYAEAEEIEQDLEKIRRWFARVTERDWFGAPGRAEVEAWLVRCAELLDGFYADVHARSVQEENVNSEQGPEAAEMSARLKRVASPARPKAPRPRAGTARLKARGPRG